MATAFWENKNQNSELLYYPKFLVFNKKEIMKYTKK